MSNDREYLLVSRIHSVSAKRSRPRISLVRALVPPDFSCVTQSLTGLNCLILSPSSLYPCPYDAQRLLSGKKMGIRIIDTMEGYPYQNLESPHMISCLGSNKEFLIFLFLVSSVTVYLSLFHPYLPVRGGRSSCDSAIQYIYTFSTFSYR